MNARLHPVFAAALMPVTPPSLFAVTIEFDDGTYRGEAWGRTEDEAIRMCQIDARMASPFAQFNGKVISHSAVLA